MGGDLWPVNFVGGHFYLVEPGAGKGHWDEIPLQWKNTRFDAIDVLFISPFFILDNDLKFGLSRYESGRLDERFDWVVRAARTQKPDIKIIVMQFYDGIPPPSDFKDTKMKDHERRIEVYATSVADYIEKAYHRQLPSLTGGSQVSARIDGYDVDVEGGTDVAVLPLVLKAVRSELDALAQRLGSSPFSVSVSAASTDNLGASVARSCNYINMQNYSGGSNVLPEDYQKAVPGLRASQLAWGFTSETPWTDKDPSTGKMYPFSEINAKAAAVAKGEFGGTFNWRLNSDNYPYENAFQVWLYNTVHGVTLPNSKSAEVIAKHWPTGGRDGGQGGTSISTEDLI